MRSSREAPRLQWVNHASFVIRTSSVRLVCDPWTTGSVFDDGWDLQIPDDGAFDPGSCTHVWLSHEHPDHFNPATLRRIPEWRRPAVTVLVARTVDRRVAGWCERAGFDVVELDGGGWVRLGDACAVRTGVHDNGDSWLAVHTSAGTILNLNDCVITSPRECRTVRDAVGPVDVLATQFSFANRIANPDDDERAARAVATKLSWLRTQVRAFTPRAVIPFASYSWFSHEDNFYMNRWMVPPEVAVDVVREVDGVEALVLAPGDEWQLGDPVPDEARAIARYADARRARLAAGPVHAARTVALDELLAHGREHLAGLAARNGAWLRALPATDVHVRDHGVSLRLSARGVRETSTAEEDCDVSCRSDALDTVFRLPWGGRTLDINGRFTVPVNGRYERFKAYSTVASFNSRDEGIGAIARTAARRAGKRIWA